MQRWFTRISTALVGVALLTGTALAAVQNDLLVFNSSLAGGSADGFVGKGTYKNGARVWLAADARYEQDCTKTFETGPAKKRVTHTVTIHRKANVNTTKEATYTPRNNPRLKLTGYFWDVAFSLDAPSNDLCQMADESGFQPDGPVSLVEASGKVYLSNDDGATSMLDTITGLPIEVALNP
jgi:hypothetical protein